jgi:Predicted transcriptional regulators
MSQKELAGKIGVTQGAISQWEKGISSPKSDKLPILAQTLKCSIDDLYKTA